MRRGRIGASVPVAEHDEREQPRDESSSSQLSSRTIQLQEAAAAAGVAVLTS